MTIVNDKETSESSKSPEGKFHYSFEIITYSLTRRDFSTFISLSNFMPSNIFIKTLNQFPVYEFSSPWFKGRKIRDYAVD